MPTEAELRTRTDEGVEVIYTRRAVIQGVPAATIESRLALSDCLYVTLKGYNFFSDADLIFASDAATVTAVDVTTTYAPVEETP